MCLLPEGPPPITSSPAPGLLFPSTGASCQSPPSLSLGRALSFYFAQLQRPLTEVPLPLTSQTCSNDPRERGVQSGTTSAPSLRTSCTSQACSLSSPLFFYSTLHPIPTSPTITSRLVDLDCSFYVLSCLLLLSIPHILVLFLNFPSILPLLFFCSRLFCPSSLCICFSPLLSNFSYLLFSLIHSPPTF